MSFADKLFDKLAITDGGCWEFVGGRTSANYGALSYQSQYKSAHIVAYEYFNEEVPTGMKVCHTCDNPPCCNPEHLFLGTTLTNKHDEMSKGRHAHGERQGNHILTEDDVRNIKRRLAEGATLAGLGRRYNVTKQAIYQIKVGNNWSHI